MNTTIKRFKDKWEFVQYYNTYLEKLANRIYTEYGDQMYIDKDDIHNTLLTVAAERFNSLNSNEDTVPTKENVKSTISRLKPYIEASLFRDTTHTIGIPLISSAELKGRTKVEKETTGVKYQSITQNKYNEEELLDYTEDISDEVIFNTIKETLVKCLCTLTQKEQQVIKLRFGLGTKNNMGLTLDECGRLMGINRTRVAQIEAKALRKLRHPSKANMLRGYLD